MTSFLDPLIAFVSAHAWLAYLTLFLAALLEAVPVVGALVPGSTIILALSALVPGGEVNLWAVLASAIAGALVGDGTAYIAGHRSQREILNAWPLTNYPGVVAQSAPAVAQFSQAQLDMYTFTVWSARLPGAKEMSSPNSAVWVAW